MKLKRHTKILELIHEYDIETQEELAQRLEEAGFKVTQATVSRDIRELCLTKVANKKDAVFILFCRGRIQISVKNIPECFGMLLYPWIRLRIFLSSKQFREWPWAWQLLWMN